MARRNDPTAMIVQQAITMALRQRRNRGVWVAVALVLLVGTMLWSHYRTQPDPSQWDGRTATVQRVVDGDTIVVDVPGGHETVRLIGVDAPEIAHKGAVGSPIDSYFGPEAKRYLTDALAGRTITLKFDGTEKRDRYQRLLGYVYLNDTDCVNVMLVRDGYAYVDRRFKNMLQATLDQSETQARTRGVGLWKNVKPEQMPVWRQKWLAKKTVSADDD